MKADQLYFTSCRRGVLGSGNPGFQILAVTPAISEEERTEIGRLLTYTPGPDLPVVPTAEELAAFPMHRGYVRLRSGRQVVFQSTYRGVGHGGRLGNYFGHALVFPAEPLPLWPAAVDWSSYLRTSAAETEEHVMATGDTALPELEIAPGALPFLPGLQRRELADWLGADGRLELLAALLEATVSREGPKKRLVLLGPEEETGRWIAALQASLPRAWQCLASYGTYFPDPGRAPTAIVSSRAPGESAIQELRRGSRVVDTGKLPPSADLPSGTIFLPWLQTLWKSSEAACQVPAEAGAAGFAPPVTPGQLAGGFDWLCRRSITPLALAFVRDCATPAGWLDFWSALESCDHLTTTEALELAAFLGPLQGHPEQGARAWKELTEMPRTVLSPLIHRGEDPGALAAALAAAAGERLPELVTALADGGFHEELANPGEPAFKLFDLYTRWIAEARLEAAGMGLAVVACFHRLMAPAGPARAAEWFNRLPLAWQGQALAACLPDTPGEVLADWTFRALGSEALHAAVAWTTREPALLEQEKFSPWLTALLDKVFEKAATAEAKGIYQSSLKSIEKLPAASRRTFETALFTAYTRTCSAPPEVAAACLEYLKGMSRGGAAAADPAPVLRLLDEVLPFSGPPVDRLKDRDLKELLRYAGDTGSPCQVLQTVRVLRSIASGEDWERSAAPWLAAQGDWEKSLAPGRVALLAEALGSAFALRKSPLPPQAVELQAWISARLPTGSLGHFLRPAVQTARGAAALLAAACPGDEDKRPGGPSLLLQKLLHERWVPARAKDRADFRKRAEDLDLPAGAKERIGAWFDELPPRPGIFSRLKSQLASRWFGGGPAH